MYPIKKKFTSPFSLRKAQKTSSVLIVFLIYIFLTGCQKTTTSHFDPDQSQLQKLPEQNNEQTFIPQPEITLLPETPAPGDFTLLRIGPLPFLPEITIDTDLIGDISLPFEFQNYAYVFLGTSYRTEPGQYEIEVHIDNLQPDTLNITIPIEIVTKDFPVSRFSMPPSRTAGWTAEGLRKAREKVNTSRKITLPEPLWNAPFIWPVKGRISSEFGALRIINDRKSYHSGIDIAKPGGTPVKASNCGIVRLADHLPAQGKIVILDHGLDISSSYLHLKEISVSEGQKVENGDAIGTVGMTGYATGNHLHWSIHIGHMPVNPEQFVTKELANPFSFHEYKKKYQEIPG